MQASDNHAKRATTQENKRFYKEVQKMTTQKEHNILRIQARARDRAEFVDYCRNQTEREAVMREAIKRESLPFLFRGIEL